VASVDSATLPCASITLIKFQGVISAGLREKPSTPSVYGFAKQIMREPQADYRTGRRRSAAYRRKTAV